MWNWQHNISKILPKLETKTRKFERIENLNERNIKLYILVAREERRAGLNELGHTLGYLDVRERAWAPPAAL